MTGGPAAAAVAIVGLACELPDARSPEALWDNVLAGRRAFRRIPATRLDLRAYGHPDPAAPDRTYATHAALIEGYAFDRRAFRISPDAHAAADPAHWLALDVAARALADAGWPDAAGLPPDTTGVVVGNTLTGEVSRAAGLRLRWPYVRRVVADALAGEGWDADRRTAFLDDLEASFKAPFPPVTEDTLAGGLSNTIAGRISGHFDLHGGGFTVDGACAGALLAVIQACDALVAGRLDAAVAGGVDLSLDPFELVGFAKAGALARGAMRVYDAAPTGFWPGEGCAMFVLMRLADARAAGRPVHAVIRGWGVASDGAGGITRPEAAGQRRALERAYRLAGIGPASVGYVEGHGTGTAVGDAVELAAASEVLRADGARPGATAIGSVKALIGHTKAAAGAAGLVKAVMAVRTGIIPPTTGCEDPHPLLADPDAVLRAPAVPEAWPNPGPRRAGISAFGFGGIDTHVVIEAADASPASRRARRRPPESRPTWPRPAPDAELLCFAAGTRDDLVDALNRIERFVADVSSAELGDLAAALAARAADAGPGARHRAAVVARTPEEAAAGIAAARRRLPSAVAPDGAGPTPSGSAGPPRDATPSDGAGPLRDATPSDGAGPARDTGPSGLVQAAPGAFVATRAGRAAPRIVFVFPGQGSPVRAGGAWVKRFPELAERFAGGAEGASVGSDRRPEPPSTAFVQPNVVGQSIAALDTLARLGVRADVAVGHSLGELAALHWAGALAAPAIVRLAAARGQAMAAVEPAGTMAALTAPAEAAAELVAAIGDPQLVVAALNGPAQTVIAGPEPSVARAIDRAAAAGIRATPLAVAGAFHSPLMAPAGAALAAALEADPPGAPRRTVVSTITGAPLGPDDDLPALLVRQLTAPVRFTEALARASDGADLVIEVGPGHVAGDLARGVVGVPVVSVDAGGPSLAGLAAAAGAAFAAGGDVPSALFADRLHRPFELDRRPTFLENPCDRGAADRADGPDAASTDAGASDPASPRHSSNGASGAPARAPSSNGSAGMAAAIKHAPPAFHPTPSPDGASLDPTDLLRAIVARRLDIPPGDIRPQDRFRADLHLASITVAEIVAEAARALGVTPPGAPTDFATASLEDAGAALSALPPAGADDGRPPAGVAAWIRPFHLEWVAAEPPAGRFDGPRRWRILGSGDVALTRDIAAVLADGDELSDDDRPCDGLIVVLARREDPTAGVSHLLDAAVQAGRGDVRRLVVVHDGFAGAAAFTRCLAQEGVDAACVEAPFDAPGAAAWVAEEARAAVVAVEVRRDAGGGRWLPRLSLVWPGADADACAADACDAANGERPSPRSGYGLTAGDVLLVTGGGKGIGAEAALALARSTGVRLGLVGRGEPGRDAELDRQLERFGAHAARFAYRSADVTDAAAVARAVADVEAELGPVTAVLHAAGRNVPRRSAELDRAEIEATLGPKVAGLDLVLAALADHPPRLLLTFGSVIARAGMAGEAHYALANARLREATAAFGREHPGAVALCVEWSVWAGLGMGERLGRVAELERGGITALAPDAAVAALLELVATGAHGSVVVAGRLGTDAGAAGGLVPPLGELPLYRFLEQPRAWVPGVEIVADNRVSVDTDPYLADHALDGTPLLPGVIGLEAMAQAAAALSGRSGPVTCLDVAFRQAVPVTPGETIVLRVAALVTAPGRVEAALRCDTTGFAVDHVRATLLLAGASDEREPADGAADRCPPARCVPTPGTPSPHLPAVGDLYDDRLFQRGRLRRLSGYRRLSATACEADLAPAPDGERWFGPYLPQDRVLGDPGARDAALQAIQACVPHRRVLPVGVDAVRVFDAAAKGVRVRAGERVERRDAAAGAYVFDLDLRDAEGRCVERWVGLRLRATGMLPAPVAWPLGLLGPYLERRAGEILGRAPELTLRTAESGGRGGLHRADGKPEPAGGRSALSRSRAEGIVLEATVAVPAVEVVAGAPETAVSAPSAGFAADRGGLGCDVEWIRDRPWSDIVGPDGVALARVVAAATGEAVEHAAARVWAAREAGIKAGWPRPLGLTFDSAAGDGWVVLDAGLGRVATAVVSVLEQASPLAFAVTAGPGGAP